MIESNNTSSAGFVWLVGAGPGAADLITVRGLRLLERAEVVVHDELAGRDLLTFCPATCELISVGKRAGSHSASQSEINALLVKLGQAGRKVVRLKGGDPMIFGRAGEEIEALRAAGIGFEVVPGVTAATASSAMAELPLTHRDYSSAVVFVTGHQCAANTSALDWASLAKLRATLCFYMGVRRLPEIASNLIGHGMPPEMPLALVCEATLPTQRVLIGTLANAEQLAGSITGQAALVVVGEVVRLSSFAKELPELAAKAGYAE
jgi:uroporphyrin-III C-methyltransferase